LLKFKVAPGKRDGALSCQPPRSLFWAQSKLTERAENAAAPKWQILPRLHPSPQKIGANGHDRRAPFGKN